MRQNQAFWRPSSLRSLGPMGKLEGSGNRLGAPEPSLWPSTSHGPGLEGAEPLPPHACLCESLVVAVCLSFTVCETWSPHLGGLERTEGHGLMPVFFRDDSWARYGNLALKEPPTEICLLLARLGPWRVNVVPWDSCPVWSGQRITFIW